MSVGAAKADERDVVLGDDNVVVSWKGLGISNSSS